MTICNLFYLHATSELQNLHCDICPIRNIANFFLSLMFGLRPLVLKINLKKTTFLLRHFSSPYIQCYVSNIEIKYVNHNSAETQGFLTFSYYITERPLVAGNFSISNAPIGM